MKLPLRVYHQPFLCSLFIIILFIINNPLLAQTPGKISIKGQLKDTSEEFVTYATVMLLNPADSVLINFTTTNEKGNFEFKTVKNTKYILKVSHIHYMPIHLFLEVNANNINDLGIITLKPINQTLMEVVIKAAKAPLYIRGDTVEYDASTFKVPPGSTVEDLLKRLPGIEVDNNGKITTQGKDVKRVYVEGKTFFGDDPKSVTKNLDAAIVSKVQVFDEKSEQEKLTGIDDGSKEKAMNLELKDEFKNGKFGKISIAGGTEERWSSSGNFNKFNSKMQLSFIGYANNINQTGLNWEDYGEFNGNNSFNEYDNGDFGFGSGDRRFYIMTGANFNDYQGWGLTKNFGGGVNYNYDNKGYKFNTSYFIKYSDLNTFGNTFRQTYLENNNSFIKTDTISKDQSVTRHSIGSRFEREFNKKDKFIAKFNYDRSSNGSNSTDILNNTDFLLNPLNKLLLSSISDRTPVNINSAAIFRHLFAKKGRSFAVSVAYNQNNESGQEDIDNLNKLFNASTPDEQIKQLIAEDKKLYEIKSGALYTEPLSKSVFAEIFLNFSDLTNNKNRQANDKLQLEKRIDSLSSYYQQNTEYYRLGTSLRYGKDGLNIAIGIAAQNLALKGNYALDKGYPVIGETSSKNFFNFTPNLEIVYELKRQMHISCNYSNQISIPSFEYLYPAPNTTNPSYQVKGNPNLKVSSSHNISLSYGYWNSATFASFHISTEYGYTQGPIIFTQSTLIDPKQGVITIAAPENLDHKYSVSNWVWINIPIIKTKLSISGNLDYNHDKSPTKINLISDLITSNDYNGGVRLTYNLGENLALSGGLNTSFTFFNYDNLNNLDQNYYNLSERVSLKWQFIKKTFFESEFSYTSYINKKFDFDQKLPNWSLSVRRLIGKKNQFEIRLAIFDLLNKNIYLSQSITNNYYLKTQYNTLNRYIMLSASYNIKGFETKLNKRGFW